MKIIIVFKLLIISFVLISCSKSDDSKSSTTSLPASSSGVTASGSITVGSDTLSGTYATSCVNVSSISAKPTDTTHLSNVIVITGSSTFTREVNYYTDSACTSLSLGWYFNSTNVVVGDASGSDYKVAYTQANQTIMANTTAGETFIESFFGGSSVLDVTVGTAYVMTSGIPYYNMIKVSGTTLYFGSESPLAYPSTSEGSTLTK